MFEIFFNIIMFFRLKVFPVSLIMQLFVKIIFKLYMCLQLHTKNITDTTRSTISFAIILISIKNNNITDKIINLHNGCTLNIKTPLVSFDKRCDYKHYFFFRLNNRNEPNVPNKTTTG